MSERIKQQQTDQPPSASVVLGFVENVLRGPRAGRLKELAIAAAFQIIASNSQPVEWVVVESENQLCPGTQFETDDPNRGKEVYRQVAIAITGAVIDEAVTSATRGSNSPAHITIVTTDAIDPAVREHAAGVYQKTGGIEFAILDCLGFVRHFLYLFHRHRVAFLDAYQALVLNEPESAANFAFKQIFLALLQAATAVSEVES